MKIFRNKRQIERLNQAAQTFPTATIVETSRLKLVSVRIGYNISRRKPFTAQIVYAERLDFGNQGTTKELEFDAASMEDLIDKVLAHFEEGENTAITGKES